MAADTACRRARLQHELRVVHALSRRAPGGARPVEIFALGLANPAGHRAVHQREVWIALARPFACPQLAHALVGERPVLVTTVRIGALRCAHATGDWTCSQHKKRVGQALPLPRPFQAALLGVAAVVQARLLTGTGERGRYKGEIERMRAE